MRLNGRRALFISYNGMLDPLGQTQVLPYLKELTKAGVEFTLLSFERSDAFTPEGEIRCRELQKELAQANIDWHRLRYHKRFSLPATVFDVLVGIRHASRLLKQKRIELVHARSHIPATIALALKKKFGVRMIFDLRGLMAEEYVDAGHWRKQSLKFKLSKAVERRIFAATDAVVTLTHRIWPIIKDWDGLRDREVDHTVVPCCADLDLFSFKLSDRALRRNELGLGNKLTIVYSGSVDGWYLTDRMADFFSFVLSRRPDAHFLWLTPACDRVTRLMRESGVSTSNFTVKFVRALEVPSYLSAADVGLAFITPAFSKLASSPTKFAEYLGCGLPLITNSGIGDSDELITTEATGALVSEFNDREYARALATAESFLQSVETTRAHARLVAEKFFDVRRLGAQRYCDLYERLLQT